MKRNLLFLLLAVPLASLAQVSPVYYMSNYLRVVQPDVDDSSDMLTKQNDIVSYHNLKVKFDTLLNPFTGGMNNPTFFNIDFNGDGIGDLYVFDRDIGENQFLLFQGLGNSSTGYQYAPQYHHCFPDSIAKWAEMVDYNGDHKPDLFTGSPDPYCNTCIKAYKNTSYIDPVTKKYITRFRKVADSLCYYNDTGGQQEIDVSIASNPQFVDVDKDGYLDILAFDINLISPRLFHNRGKFGNGDSLSFYYTKECWGYFTEITQHLYQPWNCELGGSNSTGTWDSTFHSSSAHLFNSMTAFDLDGDGDIDLLMGDGLNDSLAFLENGRINFNDPKNRGYHKDTMININYHFDDNHFPIDYPAIMPVMPTASYVDINHDSLNDLVVAAGEPTNTTLDTTHVSDRLYNIWYYRNVGSRATDTTLEANIFKITTKDFLRNTMVDWGINSAPCFIDVDKDGRKDLIIAVRDGSAPHGNSHLVLYLNKAGKTPGSKPYMLYQTEDYLGFSKLPANIDFPSPAAYLNTKDSSTDLLMGNSSGEVMYFKDRSTGKAPADFQLATSALQYLSKGKMMPIEVDLNSAPTSADINGDGKMDLLIGCNDGSISYYRCLGFGPSPDYVPYFELVTDTFGNLDTRAGLNYDVAPCAVDLDGDGKLDLLVGDRYGRLWYYHDFDTTHTLLDTVHKGPFAYLPYLVRVHDYGTGRDSTQRFSTYTKPAVAYLDQDSLPDIMLGCLRGGLLFLGSANNALEDLSHSSIPEPRIYNPMGMTLYPNPARDMVSLDYNNLERTQNVRLTVSDMLGRQVLMHPFVLKNGKNDERFSISGLANGIYIVDVESGGELLFGNKLIIDK